MQVWYVNVYEVGREFGGPEEGGWYYDFGHYLEDMSFMVLVPNEDMAWTLRDLLDDALAVKADEDGIPRVSSVLYEGGRYGVQVDSIPGASYPEEAPRYE